MKNIKQNRMLILFAAASILTGCGKSDISTHYGVSESESEYSRPEASDAAEELAETTTTTEALTTAAITETTAAAMSEQVEVTVAEPEALGAPVLMARALTEGTFLKPGKEIAYEVGDEFEVLSFNVFGAFSDNTFTILTPDGDANIEQLSEFTLLPTEEYIASLDEVHLKRLAPALYLQYADLYRRYIFGMEPIGLESTDDLEQLNDVSYYIRMEPKCTWAELMRNVHQYFAEDFVITVDGKPGAELNGYLLEKDGYIWRMDGYGVRDIKTYAEVKEIRSRTEDEIIFDMAITRTDAFFTEESETTNETFILRCEDGMWKCAEIPLEWDMS